jgi:hypothetical protein
VTLSLQTALYKSNSGGERSICLHLETKSTKHAAESNFLPKRSYYRLNINNE